MIFARSKSGRSHAISGFLVLLIGMFCLASSQSVFAQAYEGSEYCIDCHLENYSDWLASGHRYKLMARDEARNRPIPLPGGFTWDDISWVIGGYKWKSRYIDNDGYIITTTESGPGANQYNYMVGTWTDYNAGVANKPYDCGRCHTTGWIADTDPDTDGTLDDNQGGLPGMHGTFAFGGIHCEECHGPGDTMERDTSPELCGRCHIRGEANTIPASGGFIRHHEQYNEFLASPHKNMTCVSCHNPHKPGPFSIKEGRDCETCHPDNAASYLNTEMYAAGVECIDCHMPYASKSAAALGPFKGDLKTHLFRISTDADFEMFNAEGSFVNLMEIDGDPNQGMVGLDFACLRCHGNQTKAWAASYAEGFHSTEFRISGGISGTWFNVNRDGEGWLIDSANLFVAAFYTYNNVGDTTWVIGVGAPETTPGMLNMVTIELEIPVEPGPSFGSAYNPNDKNTVPFGTAKFTFTSCTAGEVLITPNAEYLALGYEVITIPIVRLTSPEISCPGTG